MKKVIYEIELYDLKGNVGIQTWDDKYTNKKEAIKNAKELFNHFWEADKKHTSVLVNALELQDNGEYENIGTIKEFRKNNNQE